MTDSANYTMMLFLPNLSCSRKNVYITFIYTTVQLNSAVSITNFGSGLFGEQDRVFRLCLAHYTLQSVLRLVATLYKVVWADPIAFNILYTVLRWMVHPIVCLAVIAAAVDLSNKRCCHTYACWRGFVTNEDFLLHFEYITYMTNLILLGCLNPGVVNFKILVEGSMSFIIM